MEDIKQRWFREFQNIKCVINGSHACRYNVTTANQQIEVMFEELVDMHNALADIKREITTGIISYHSVQKSKSLQAVRGGKNERT